MIREKIKQLTTQTLQSLGLETGSFALEHPTELSHGDYACNVAMILAKEAGKNPRELADEIAKKMGEQLPAEIERVEVAGPGFINFYLSKEFSAHSLAEILSQKENFGKNNETKETWVIEHTSPNPNKAMHLGHLRNNLVGMAVANLAEWNGVTVIRDMVNNNRGIAIAKLMWGYLKFAKKDSTSDNTAIDYWFDHQDEWQTPEGAGMRPDRFVDDLYVRGSEDFKNPEVEEIVRNFVVLWEAKDEKTWALWQKVLDYSMEGQEMTLKRLGNKWDNTWNEHEHYQEGKDLVAEGLEKGIFKKLDDGAVLTDLAAYNIPDTIVQKKDGTALYITQDLALTRLKKEKYHADRLLWVIGPEQSLAMKQMFAVSEQLGTGSFEDFVHLSYGYMSLKGKGKMASREGTVIYIDELIDQVKDEVKQKLQEGGRENNDELAETVALGAVKFAILRVGRTQDTAFDIQSSVSLDGDSGPYLQYTYARSQSLLEKGRSLSLAPDTNMPLSQITNLEKLLYRFPEIVAGSLDDYAPHNIANYLIEIAREFNSFYGNTQIVVADDETSAYKLAITAAVATVLQNGLAILGIPVPERM